MKRISFTQYGPVIGDRAIGEQLFNKLVEMCPKEEPIEIDLNGVESMATYCAKQIFGGLYKELGAQKFGENIVIKNATKNVQVIIRLGIQSVIESI